MSADKVIEVVRERAEQEFAGRWRVLRVVIEGDDGELLEFADALATRPSDGSAAPAPRR
jgi:hypothetical protein